MDYTVHGILQARILEWGDYPFSRGSSQPRDLTQISGIAGRFFAGWTIREAHRVAQIVHVEARNVSQREWKCAQSLETQA